MEKEITPEQALDILGGIVDKNASGPKAMFINAQIAIDVLKKLIDEKKEK